MIHKLSSIGRRFIKSILGLSIKSDCYSQEGEDLILQRIFPQGKIGFFVDIGAHHPTRFSNTYLLYRCGWHGLVIDAMPGSMHAFKRMRPRDLCCEIGISDKDGVKDFYIFHERALNTFDSKLAEQRKVEGWKLDKVHQVKLRTINAILDENLPLKRHIDLLTIDIEGLDDIVLNTLDFVRYRPSVIICEALSSSIEDVLASNLAFKLKKEGYTLFSKLLNSAIWKLKEET